MRTVGAVVRGIRTPIIRENDDLVSIVRDSVLAAVGHGGLKEGQIIRTSFSFSVKEREHQGKTYYQCQLKGWRAEII